MSVYNSDKFLKKSIESVLVQTLEDFEFIIIDDCSTDDSSSVINEYVKKDDRIVFIQNKVNLGLTKSLNIGLKRARGKYIARLDADDVSLSNRFKNQSDFLDKNPNIFLCGGGADLIDEKGEKIGSGDNESVFDLEEIKKILPIRNCFFHSSIMFRNSDVSYRDKFYYSQDYDLYLRLLSEKKGIANMKGKLIYWRVSGKSLNCLNRTKQALFANKAREFYHQRSRGGGDEYEKFNANEIKDQKIEENTKAILLEDKITRLLKEGKTVLAGKIFRNEYIQVIGKKDFKKKVGFFIFCHFPFSYSLYRRIFYKQKVINEKSLALFFTEGISLKSWDDVGSIERELAIYNYLAKHFDKIYLVSYGKEKGDEYRKYMADNIVVLGREDNDLPHFLYQFIIPFKFFKILKNCRFLKTNQVYASIPAIICKLIKPQNKLIIRGGYVASLSAELYKTSIKWLAYTKILEFLAYRISDKVFMAGEANGDYLLSKYSFLKKKLEVLNNGIDLEIFKPLDIQKEFDVGYVGRLNDDKNLLNLLQAIKGKKLKICFIGQGEKKESLLKFANENGIDLKIIDKVKNHTLPKFYNKFKIFAFPSLHEGNPKTLLEAMACGVPVLGCDVVGVRNIIKNKETGILTDTDTESIMKGLDMLLEKDQLSKRVAVEGRKFTEKHYSLKKVLKKEKEIYEKIN